jgi:TPR repeat protein
MTGPVDLDESGSRFISHRYPQAIAARQAFAPDDPMPLFLSDPPEATEAPRAGEIRVGASTTSRILKLCTMTAAAAAIAFGIMSVDNPLALFANAKASLPGISAQPGTPSISTVRTVAVVPVLPANAGAAAAPTRDEIAAALRTARQSQPEIRQPPAAAAPARRLDADELAVLLKRARSLIAVGDIAPARLLLERAADAQEAGAALLLAQTYDPAVLGTPDTRSITPDPAAARDWYQKAARFGSPEAQQRLSQMQN